MAQARAQAFCSKPVVCEVDGTLGSRIGSFRDTIASQQANIDKNLSYLLNTVRQYSTSRRSQSIEEQGNSKVQNSFQEPSHSDVMLGVKSMSVDPAAPSIRKRTIKIPANGVIRVFACSLWTEEESEVPKSGSSSGESVFSSRLMVLELLRRNRDMIFNEGNVGLIFTKGPQGSERGSCQVQGLFHI